MCTRLDMEYMYLRVRVPKVTYMKYKILCAHLNLSMPKQTAALLKTFVDIQEGNEIRINREVK